MKRNVNETTNVNEDNDKEQKKKVLEIIGDIDKGVKDGEEETSNEGYEAESLQDIQTQAAKILTEKDRNLLYEKGVRLKRKGNNRHALPCFLGCLQGLRERDHFTVLPECLHNIAEIYSQEEDYDAAIQFAQAEKLYYETALITVDKDNKTESVTTAEDIPDGTSAGDGHSQNQGSSSASSSEALKAEEYEKLAHMCLKQQNPQLALDYCAKAVKLQQSCFGEQHPVTLQTLDLFTVIYAEMGKQQYKAALEKFSAAQEKEKERKTSSKETTEEKDAAISTESKRQGKNPSRQNEPAKMKNMNKCDDHHPSQTTSEETQASQDTVKLTLTSSQALILYFIITIVLAFTLTAALCYLTQTDPQSMYNYMITRLRFYYYYYFKRKGTNGNQYF